MHVMVPHPRDGTVDRIPGFGPEGNTLAGIHQEVFLDPYMRVELRLLLGNSYAEWQAKPGHDDNRSH